MSVVIGTYLMGERMRCFNQFFENSLEAVYAYQRYCLDLQEDCLTTAFSCQNHYIESLDAKSWGYPFKS